MKRNDKEWKEMYDYIYSNYTISKSPVSMKHLSNKFNKSLEYMNWFLIKYDLTRKCIDEVIDIEDKVIVTLLDLGYTKTFVAEVLGVTNGNITYRLKQLKVGDLR